MRIFALVPALATLATAVLGVSLPRADDCGLEMGCDFFESVSKRDSSSELGALAVRNVRGLTNAELLRRGLPLKGPVMRRGTPVRRDSPSDVPKPGKHYRGYIEVRSLDDGSTLGYVSASSLIRQHRYQSIDSALIVHFDTDSTGSGSKINIIPENSDMPFGFVGMVQGRDDGTSDLDPNSFQYAYLAGTNETPPGSTPALVGNSYPGPQRTSESAVWSFDSKSEKLSPYWVNTDGSIPQIKYFVQSTGIYMGGNPGAFHARYPAPIANIEFIFVPI